MSSDETWRHDPATTAEWFEPANLTPRADIDFRRDDAFVQTVDTEVVDVLSTNTPTSTNSHTGLIRYDLRRIEVAPNKFVQEYTVKLNVSLDPDPALGPDTVADIQGKVKAGVDSLLNRGYRLPSGDEFHVNVQFTDTGAHAAVKVGNFEENSQTTWRPDASEQVLAHEILHYLGVPDEGRDARIALRQHAQNSGVHDEDGGIMTSDVLGHDPRLHPRHLWIVERTANSQVSVPASLLTSADDARAPLPPREFDEDIQPVETRRAAGFEGEIHGYAVTLPPDVTSYDFDFVVRTPILKLVLDTHLRRSVLEIVTEPAAAVPGDDGRPTSQQLLDGVRHVMQRLRQARPGASLGQIFHGEEYSVDPLAEDLRVRPMDGPRSENMYVHHSVGVPLAGLSHFMRDLLTVTRNDFGPAVTARSHLEDALRVAHDLGESMGWGADTSPAGRAAAEGFVALAYTQFAAMAQWVQTGTHLAKNFTAMGSRMSMAAVADGLEPGVREHLDRHGAAIAKHFSASFRNHFSGGTREGNLLEARIPYSSDETRTTIGDYLHSAFSKDENRLVVSQDDALNIRTTLPELDANRDESSSPRIDPPLVVLELRYLGLSSASVSDIADTHAALVDRSRQAFRVAQRLLGISFDADVPPVQSGRGSDPQPGEAAGGDRHSTHVPPLVESPISSRTSTLFGPRSKQLSGTQRAELDLFARDLVDQARQQLEAGRGGLHVRAEGGGNGGRFSRGADAVGQERADATLDYLRTQIRQRLETRGMDPDAVTVSREPTSRGTALDDELDGPVEKVRRTVKLTVERRLPAPPAVITAAPNPVPEAESSHAGLSDGGTRQRGVARGVVGDVEPGDGVAERSVLPVSGQSRADVEGWIGDVNNDGDASVAPAGERLTNCGPTTWVVFDRLSGIPSFGRALSVQLRAQDIGDATGLPLRGSDPEGIAEQLREAGAGAHTVVVAQFDNGVAHSFNALFDGDRVWAIDGQHGTITAWPPELGRPGNPVTNWFTGTPAAQSTGVDTSAPRNGPGQAIVTGLGSDLQHLPDTTGIAENTDAANLAAAAAESDSESDGEQEFSAALSDWESEAEPVQAQSTPTDVQVAESTPDPRDTTLFVAFDEHDRTLRTEHDAQVAAFAADVVGHAAREHEAGRSGVSLKAEGGGNGGLFSRGADEVGRLRADAVLNAIRAHILDDLRERRLPERIVAFPEAPRSRGRALTDDIPGPGNAARRRVVAVRVSLQPQAHGTPERPDDRRVPESPAGTPPNSRDLRDIGWVGTHGARVVEDSAGQRWLMKTPPAGDEFLSDLQTAVGGLQAAVGLPIPTTYLLDGGPSTIRQWLPAATLLDSNALSDQDLSTLQKHQVFDWLISNHDAHAAQFLRNSDGDIIGIDKDQAFRYFGRDELSWRFHPNRFYGQAEPLYNTVWRRFSEGRAGISLSDPRTGDVGEFITRLQAIDDQQLRELIRPYAVGAAKAGKLTDTSRDQPGLTDQRHVANDVESFLSAVIERKSRLFEDFGALYEKALHQRATPQRPSAQLDPTVDPYDVSGVYAIANSERVLHFRDRDDNGLLYREDSRPPEVVFEEGFAVRPDYRHNSKVTLFISTTRNPDLLYLREKTTDRVFRYTIDAPGGIDVNRTVGIRPSDYQQEISFPGGIRRENIVSAVEVLPIDEDADEPMDAAHRYGPVAHNPHFNPETPNLEAPETGRRSPNDLIAANENDESEIRFAGDTAGSVTSERPDPWDQYIAALYGDGSETSHAPRQRATLWHRVSGMWALARARFGAEIAGVEGTLLASGHTASSLAQRYPSLAMANQGRNPGQSEQNCVTAAFAFLMSEREGDFFAAPLNEALPGRDLLNFQRQALGLGEHDHRAFAVSDFRMAARALAAGGSGSRAMIAVRNGDGSAINHVLVGLVDETGVSFVDPQRGGLATDPVDATGLAMLPVTPGIVVPDGARLLTAEEVATSDATVNVPEASSISSADRHEVLSRLAAGDVVSLLHAGEVGELESSLSRVRDRLREYFPDRHQQVESDLEKMVELLEDSRITINFHVDESLDALLSGDGESTTPGESSQSTYLNGWQREAFSGDFAIQRDEAERMTGQYDGREPRVGPESAQAVEARQRVNDYLSRQSASFRPSARPRYGALDYGRALNGAAPGYGRAFMVLKEHVKHRATFTASDSMQGNPAGSTFLGMAQLLARTRDEDFRRIHRLATTDEGFDHEKERRDPDTGMDTNYVEAQLHTPIDFFRDIEAVSIDISDLGRVPTDRHAALKQKLRQYAETHNVRLELRNADGVMTRDVVAYRAQQSTSGNAGAAARSDSDNDGESDDEAGSLPDHSDTTSEFDDESDDSEHHTHDEENRDPRETESHDSSGSLAALAGPSRGGGLGLPVTAFSGEGAAQHAR